QALAAGTATLAARPAPDSGWEAIWPEPPFAVFESREQLLERAAHYAARPKEAQGLGAKAARWFDEHFSAGRRQEAFSALVLDGRAEPAFALDSAASPAEPARPSAAAATVAAVPADPAAVQAREFLEAGNKAKALELATAALKQDP